METPEAICLAVEWELSHRRTEGLFETPLTGLGCPLGVEIPTGMTLRVRAPRSGVRVMRFVNGAPSIEHSSPTSNLALERAREKVIRTVAVAGPGRLTVDVAFLEYAAILIRENYSITDDEMTGLLCTSTEWHSQMMMHVLGGDKVVDYVAGLDVDSLDLVGFDRPPLDVPVASHTDAPPSNSTPAPAHVPFWRRLLRRR